MPGDAGRDKESVLAKKRKKKDSGKSKGARLVSAKIEMTNKMNIGNSGVKMNHQPSCAITTSVKLSEPTHNKMVTSTKPMETS